MLHAGCCFHIVAMKDVKEKRACVMTKIPLLVL